MLANKKIFAAILLIVILLAGSTSLAQDNKTGEAIGCCEKKALNTNVLTTENLTEKKCTEIWYGGDDNKDYESTNWVANAVARGNKCEPKPNPTELRETGDPVYFTPQVSIPDSEYKSGANIKVEQDTSLVAQYIIAIFKYATGVIGIIATIVLMIGGIRWLSAGGNSSAVGEAKTMITSSLTGLILTLCSFLLLSMVNTSLVNFRIQAIKSTPKVDMTLTGCCEKKYNDGKITTMNSLREACTKEATGADSVDFKGPLYIADNNKCVINKGCCLVSYKSSPISSAKKVCIDNSTKEQCDNESSGIFKKWILGGLAGSYYSSFGMGNDCKKDARACDGLQVCDSFDACRQYLE